MNKFSVRRARKFFNLREPGVLPAHFPDAPVLFAFAPIDLVAQLRRDPVGMFDEVAIEIDDVKRAIWSRRGEHAVEPDRKSTRLNSSHVSESRMPSSA